MEEITFNYMKLYTPTFNLLKVPNTQVMNNRILNLTYEGFIKYIFFVSSQSEGSQYLFYLVFPCHSGSTMPQRVICSECANVLYEGDILKSPQDIAKKYDGRCPSCGKILKASIESISIYPYEEKDDK